MENESSNEATHGVAPRVEPREAKPEGLPRERSRQSCVELLFGRLFYRNVWRTEIQMKNVKTLMG